jgi:hypothetical protein
MAPGFEPKPAAYRSRIGARPPQGRRVALVVGTVLAAAVLLGTTGFALLGGTPRHTAKSAPQVPHPTVVASLERPAPAVYPTPGVYVPPFPTAAPTTRKPSVKPTEPTAPTKPTKPTAQTTTQRPTCPFQLPYLHQWCIRHGYQPPRG